METITETGKVGATELEQDILKEMNEQAFRNYKGQVQNAIQAIINQQMLIQSQQVQLAQFQKNLKELREKAPKVHDASILG